MKRKLLLFFTVVVCALLATGCRDTPEKLFEEGRYDQAYPLFVERAGINEVRLKQESVGVSYETRNRAANQSIHDYYHAAECLRRQGRENEASVYYQRVAYISDYNIRIPDDRAQELHDSYDRLTAAISDFRRAQINPDNDNSNMFNSFDYLHRQLSERRREFERLLYSTRSTQIPDINNIIREYELVSSRLDTYLRFASSRNGFEENSMLIELYWNSYSDSHSRFMRKLYNTEGIVLYETKPVSVSSTNLSYVDRARSFISSSHSAPLSSVYRVQQTPLALQEQKSDLDISLSEAYERMQQAQRYYQSLVSSGASPQKTLEAAQELNEAQRIYETIRRHSSNN